MPPKLRAQVEALPPVEAAMRQNVEPLLAQLVSLGLASAERGAPTDGNPNIGCHELVRERICSWMAQHAQDRADLTENAIRVAYAERLEQMFHGLQHHEMRAAMEAGSRALVYFVQANAFSQFSGFASSLVTSACDSRLLEALIPHLQIAAKSAPEGKLRWRCLGSLADALNGCGRPDACLPLYEQAAALARSAAESADNSSRSAWSDLASILGNWAHALRRVGYADAARKRHLESAEASRTADSEPVRVIGSELEALRIDILQGRVSEALPEVQARLAQVEAWWCHHRTGHPVPEAPDAEDLARVVISALDIATDAHLSQRDWLGALQRIDRILQIKNDLGRSAEDIAGDRMNRANVLLELPGYLQEAKGELEYCLKVFGNDVERKARVLSSLSDVFSRQGDFVQAISLERRALALREEIPDPAGRAISHDYLANFLESSGCATDLADVPRHRLSALVYCLVAGLGQHFQIALHNFSMDLRCAEAAGIELFVPRLTELLTCPTFFPLAEWLRQRGVNVEELQTQLDDFLCQARQAGT